MFKKWEFLSCAVILILILCGCSSGGNDPVLSSTEQHNPGAKIITENISGITSARVPWGVWQVHVSNPDGKVEVTQLRTAMFNCNVVQFLAPPYSPNNLMTVTILPGSDIPGGFLNLDIGLTHPFVGQERFKGFDVRCIFMADGSTVSDHDSAIWFGSEEANEAHMLNPDGLTRWWNATEFTDPLPIFSYTPGALGSDPFPSATLNPYKYYADDLTSESDVADLPVGNRGVFSADGSVIKRNFQIQFPVDGVPDFLFNYVVDASWSSPDPEYSPDYPIESFPPEAQLQEPYHVSLDSSGTTAWFEEEESGGTISLEIEIFDWQAMSDSTGVTGEIAAIRVESDVFTSPIDLLPLATVTDGSQPTSSVYEVELTAEFLNITDSGSFPLLGSIESAEPSIYQPQIPGGDALIWPDGPLATYFMGTIEISDEGPPTGWQLIFPDPPEQLSDSAGEGWHNDAPRVIKDGQDRIVVAWAQNRPDVPDQADSRPVDRISEDMGVSWNPMDTFPVAFYDRSGSLRGTKMALDGNGDAYALNYWYDSDPDWYGTMWCNFLIRCPFEDDDDWGWQTSMSLGGVELAFTVDHFPLCFEDYDLFPGYTGIQVAKGLWENSPMGLESGQWNDHSWMKIGQYYQVAEDPVALSTGPSIQQDSSGILWLAYHNGFYEDPDGYFEDPDTIYIVNNTDPSMEFWSDPLAVAVTEPPYDQYFNPTLWLDPLGGMHLAYFRSTPDDPAEYSLAYLTSSSGDPNDLGGDEIPFAGNQILEFPTLQCAELGEDIAPVIILSNDSGEVVIKWRNPVDQLWTDPIQVDLNSTATTPAIWIDQETMYVHVVWAEPDIDGFMQVLYRRGQFIEQ